MPIISSGDVTVEGKLTAEEYVVSSSVTNQTIAQASSSTEFGDDSADTHVFTGSLFITGGLTLEQGNFGIGTESPDVNFHIKLADTANARIEDTSSDGIAKLDFKNDARTSTIGVYGDDSDNFKIDHGGGSVISIDVGQNVTFPAAHSKISGSSTSTGSFGLVDSDHGIIFGSAGAYKSPASIRSNSNLLVFQGGTSGYQFKDDNNSATHIAIDSSGNVGIGGDGVSGASLTTYSDITIDETGGTSNSAVLNLKADRGSDGQDSGEIRFFNNNSDFYAAIQGERGSADTKGDLVFTNRGASLHETMRLDEDGNVLFGVANAKISGSSTSTGSFGQLRSGPQIITNNLANNVGLIVDNNTETNAIQTDAKWGPEFSQTTSDGTGLTVVRNNNDTETYPLVRFTSEHATTTQPTLTIKQDGAGYGIEIDQNGNANAIRIDGSATNNVAGIQAHCDSLTTGRIAYFYSNSSDTSTRGLVKIVNDHASATGATALEIQQDSTGTGIEITADMAISASALSTSSFGYVKGTMFSGSFQGQIGGRSTHFQTTAATQWVMTHNLGTQFVNVTVYDDNNEMIIPTTVTATSTTVMTLDFDSAVAGTAMIGLGGLSNDQGRAFIFTQDTAGTNWQITHSLGEQYPVVTFYDEQDRVILPSIIEATDHNHMDVAFEQSTSGKAMVTVGNGIPGVNANNAGNYMRVSSDGQNIVFTESVSEVTGSFDISGSITVTGEGTISSSVSSTGSFGSVVTDRNISIGTSTLGGDQTAKLYIFEDDSSFGNTGIHIENGKADDAAVIVLEGARTSTNDTAQIVFRNSDDTVARIAAFSGHGSNNDSGEIQFSISADGTASSITTAMTIDTTGFVGIGVTAPSTMLHLKSSTGSTPILTIEDTNADDNFGALQFIKDSASPGTGDKLMQIWAYGDNDAAEQILYSEIATLPTSVSDGSEEGSMRFRVMSGGSFVETMRVRANKVGIGTTNPGVALEVIGSISGSATSTGSFGKVFAEHTVQIGGPSTVSGDTSRLILDKGSGGTGTIEFTRNDGADKDWKIYTDADEGLFIEGVRAGEDLTIKPVPTGGSATELIKFTADGAKISGSSTSTGSFGHLEIGGPAGAFGKRFEVHGNGSITSAATGDQEIKFGSNRPDNLTMTMNSGGDTTLTMSETEKNILTLSKTLVSGSATSTGSFGRVFVGAGSIQTQQNQVGHYPGLLQIESDIEYGAVMTMIQNSNDAAPSLISLGKTRGTAPGSNTIVQANDLVGRIAFSSADGTDLRPVTAEIRAKVTGLPQVDSVPGELIFMTAGSGSANSIQRMVINSSGSVGIGTDNPDTTLHIQTSDASLSTADANASLIVEENDHTYIELLTPNDKQSGIMFSDGAIAGLINYNHSDNSIIFQTAAATFLTANSSQNVGIGVTPEVTNALMTSLQIGGNTNISTLKAQGASGEVDFGHNYYFSAAGTDKYISTDEATQFRQGSGNFRFRTAPSGTADNAITFTERMTILQAGNVGIGVTSPDNPFHVFKEKAGYQAYFNNDNGAAKGVKIRIKSNDAGDRDILTLQEGASSNTVLNVTKNHLISGSSTSTGSFGMVHAANKLGVGTQNPTAKLHTQFNTSSTSPQVVFGSGSLGTSGSRYPTTDGTKMSPVHFTGYQEVQTGTGVIVAEVPYISGIADSRLSGTLEVNYTAEEDSNRCGYYLFRIHYTGNTNITTVTTSTTNSSMAAVKVVADDSMGIKITPTTTGTQNVLVYYEFKGFLGTS